MKLTNFQNFMFDERCEVIKKFQQEYKTAEAKEKILKKLENKDIEFLIYCSCNIHANIFYSKFLKK